MKKDRYCGFGGQGHLTTGWGAAEAAERAGEAVENQGAERRNRNLFSPKEKRERESTTFDQRKNIVLPDLKNTRRESDNRTNWGDAH